MELIAFDVVSFELLQSSNSVCCLFLRLIRRIISNYLRVNLRKINYDFMVSDGAEKFVSYILINSVIKNCYVELGQINYKKN